MQSKERRRSVFGWVMYDWANSAYITTTAVAVLPAYFSAAVVPAQGYALAGTTFKASTLWGLTIGLSSLIVFLLAPILGAAADYSAAKKKLLMFFCWMGAIPAMLLFFAGPGLVLPTLALFFLAQVGFTGGNVFYDSLLPHVAESGRLDRISGRGFAFGYVGGGLQFALSLGLIAGHAQLGVSKDMAARIAMAFAGLWWLGFAQVTFSLVPEPGIGSEPGNGLRKGFLAFARIGFKRVFSTSKALKSRKNLLIFLLAFLLYNDGIQTVINMATIYGKEELGLSTTVLMLTLLLIQAVAVFGALLFGRLAEATSARRALMPALVLWCGVAVYGYLLTEPYEYFILGGVVGLILGGSQALSRSLFAAMIPKQASAEYFGYFSVVHKFSSIIGPLVFAVIGHMTGSTRSAILSVIVFFVLGLVLLLKVKEPDPFAETASE